MGRGANVPTPGRPGIFAARTGRQRSAPESVRRVLNQSGRRSPAWSRAAMAGRPGPTEPNDGAYGGDSSRYSGNRGISGWSDAGESHPAPAEVHDARPRGLKISGSGIFHAG